MHSGTARPRDLDHSVPQAGERDDVGGVGDVELDDDLVEEAGDVSSICPVPSSAQPPPGGRAAIVTSMLPLVAVKVR